MNSQMSATDQKKWLSPYWHVASSAIAKEVNVELKWECKVVGGLMVNLPTLTNTKNLNTGDILTRPKIQKKS